MNPYFSLANMRNETIILDYVIMLFEENIIEIFQTVRLEAQRCLDW